MHYNDITINDSSSLKRFIQNKRLSDAVKLFPTRDEPSIVIDYGAGSAEFAIRLSEKFPEICIQCYEPCDDLFNQAQKNIFNNPAISLTKNIDELRENSANVVYCLEVFEHLPQKEISDAIESINKILKQGGLFIVGVPIEIGLPALAKGVFRMLRRYGEFDAILSNIFRSVFGLTYASRPTIELPQGTQYHPHHTGFDYRMLRSRLFRCFSLETLQYSPFAKLGSHINSEVYAVFRKRNSEISTRNS